MAKERKMDGKLGMMKTANKSEVGDSMGPAPSLFVCDL